MSTGFNANLIENKFVKAGLDYLVRVAKHAGADWEDAVDSEEVNDHLKEILGLSIDDIEAAYAALPGKMKLAKEESTDMDEIKKLKEEFSDNGREDLIRGFTSAFELAESLNKNFSPLIESRTVISKPLNESKSILAEEKPIPDEMFDLDPFSLLPSDDMPSTLAFGNQVDATRLDEDFEGMLQKKVFSNKKKIRIDEDARKLTEAVNTVKSDLSTLASDAKKMRSYVEDGSLSIDEANEILGTMVEYLEQTMDKVVDDTLVATIYIADEKLNVKVLEQLQKDLGENKERWGLIEAAYVDGGIALNSQKKVASEAIDHAVKLLKSHGYQVNESDEEDDKGFATIYLDRSPSLEVQDIISKDLKDNAPDWGEFQLIDGDNFINLHGVDSMSNFKYIGDAVAHVVDILKSNGYKIVEVPGFPHLEEKSVNESDDEDENEIDAEQVMERWRDSDGYPDYNLMLDRGLWEMAADHLSGAGATEEDNAENRAINKLADEYKGKVKEESEKEFFKNMEVWIKPETNEHYFIAYGDVDYGVKQSDLADWGFNFDSGYDANGKEYKESTLDESMGEDCPQGDDLRTPKEDDEEVTEAKSGENFKNKEQQLKVLSNWLKWMKKGRMDSEREDFQDLEPGEYKDAVASRQEVEDQLSGVSGEVNGKKTDDVYEALTQGLSEEEIEDVADALDIRIDGDWGYYDNDISESKKKVSEGYHEGQVVEKEGKYFIRVGKQDLHLRNQSQGPQIVGKQVSFEKDDNGEAVIMKHMSEVKRGPEETLFTPGDFIEGGDSDSIIRDKMIVANLKHLGLTGKTAQDYHQLVLDYMEKKDKDLEKKIWDIHQGTPIKESDLSPDVATMSGANAYGRIGASSDSELETSGGDAAGDDYGVEVWDKALVIFSEAHIENPDEAIAVAQAFIKSNNLQDKDLEIVLLRGGEWIDQKKMSDIGFGEAMDLDAPIGNAAHSTENYRYAKNGMAEGESIKVELPDGRESATMDFSKALLKLFGKSVAVEDDGYVVVFDSKKAKAVKHFIADYFFKNEAAKKVRLTAADKKYQELLSKKKSGDPEYKDKSDLDLADMAGLKTTKNGKWESIEEAEAALTPPNKWLSKMKGRIQAANPSFTDEQVQTKASDLWFHKLTTAKKKALVGKEESVNESVALDWKKVGHNLEVTLKNPKDAEDINPEDSFEETFEYLMQNGMDWVSPEEIGALTDAPMFGDVSRDDQGNITDTHDVYFYQDYMTKNPSAELKEKGKVIFKNLDADKETTEQVESFDAWGLPTNSLNEERVKVSVDSFDRWGLPLTEARGILDRSPIHTGAVIDGAIERYNLKNQGDGIDRAHHSMLWKDFDAFANKMVQKEPYLKKLLKTNPETVLHALDHEAEDFLKKWLKKNVKKESVGVPTPVDEAPFKLNMDKEPESKKVDEAKNPHDKAVLKYLERVAEELSDHGFIVEEPTLGYDHLDVWKKGQKKKGFFEIYLGGVDPSLEEVHYGVFTWTSGEAENPEDDELVSHDVEVNFDDNWNNHGTISDLASELNSSFDFESPPKGGGKKKKTEAEGGGDDDAYSDLEDHMLADDSEMDENLKLAREFKITEGEAEKSALVLKPGVSISKEKMQELGKKLNVKISVKKSKDGDVVKLDTDHPSIYDHARSLIGHDKVKDIKVGQAAVHEDIVEDDDDSGASDLKKKSLAKFREPDFSLAKLSIGELRGIGGPTQYELTLSLPVDVDYLKKEGPGELVHNAHDFIGKKMDMWLGTPTLGGLNDRAKGGMKTVQVHWYIEDPILAYSMGADLEQNYGGSDVVSKEEMKKRLDYAEKAMKDATEYKANAIKELDAQNLSKEQRDEVWKTKYLPTWSGILDAMKEKGLNYSRAMRR